MLGILVVDKPLGITSHDVVNTIRRKFQTRRVGHAGTLDPLATGTLVMAIGPATRFLQYLPLEPKIYECEVFFGEERNTQDGEGEVTATYEVPQNLEELILANVPTLTGEIQQLPPMYSAVKRNGKPLYFYARQGEEIERDKRTVFIDSFELLDLTENRAHMRIVSSGGTYVRTLAHDLGQLIGCGAYLSALARTAVGKFEIEDAAPLEEANESDLIPLREALAPMPEVILNAFQEKMVGDGQTVQANRPMDCPFVQLIGTGGQTISVATVKGGTYCHPECVIPSVQLPADED
ncbi:MAG: tRNA pseudouridine(55) synthase TruB [Armatimonadetes bacterium]|nr:tRNA pseudouridine(55) synthase TruB [Armatimonadota bacterium]